MSKDPRPASDIAPTNAPSADGSAPLAAKPKPAVPAAGELTPEEQMERFAQELKETDWGHQPC